MDREIRNRLAEVAELGFRQKIYGVQEGEEPVSYEEATKAFEMLQGAEESSKKANLSFVGNLIGGILGLAAAVGAPIVTGVLNERRDEHLAKLWLEEFAASAKFEEEGVITTTLGKEMMKRPINIK